jgi:hypothetical protein
MLKFSIKYFNYDIRNFKYFITFKCFSKILFNLKGILMWIIEPLLEKKNENLEFLYDLRF